MSLHIPNAYVHRTDAMRQILKLLRHNENYISGKTDLRYAPVIAAKHESYGAFVDEMSRYRWKKKGIASVRTVYLIDEDRFFYWVFVSKGQGLVCELEELKSTINKHTRVEFAGYEAVRMPRKGEEGSPWTWQFTAERYKRLKDDIQEVIRVKDFEKIHQWMHSLRRAPSFAGVRRQAYALAKGAEGEWKRSAKGPFPTVSFAMGWQGKYKVAKQVPLYKSSLGKHLKSTQSIG